jgi:hypothetical protein
MQQERGSEILKRLAGGRQHLFDESAFHRLGEVVDQHSLKVLDWTIYGQPAIDRVVGTLRANPKDTGAIIDRLINDQARWHVRLFPYGIPWPDEVIIQIEQNSPAAR